MVGTVFALWVGFRSYSIDRHISYLASNIENCTTESNAIDSKLDVFNNFTASVEGHLQVFLNLNLTGHDHRSFSLYCQMEDNSRIVFVFVKSYF